MESRSLSVKELRERLDEAGVDYSDCFEKEDLIRRMEQTSTEVGARLNRNTSKGKRSDGSAEDPVVRNAWTNGETAKDKEPEEKRKDAAEKLKADTALIQKIKETKDYYEILGLDRKASDIDIKKAYRKLALKLHPDKCGVEGAEEAFKKVSRAFDTLSSPEKKNAYDQFGVDNIGQAGTSHGPSADDIFNAFFGGQQFGGAGMGGPRMYRSSFGSSHVHQADLDDLLSQLFGGGFYSRPNRRAYNRTRSPEGMGGSGMGGGQHRSNHPGADRRHQREDTNTPGFLNMVFPLLVLFTVLFPGGHFLGMVLNNLPMIFLLYFLPPQVRKQAFLLMVLYFFFF